jgi:hypothetical protein
MGHERDQARIAYARSLLKREPSARNLANNIVDGRFENMWIAPALDALEAAMRACRNAEAESEEGGGA